MVLFVSSENWFGVILERLPVTKSERYMVSNSGCSEGAFNGGTGDGFFICLGLNDFVNDHLKAALAKFMMTAGNRNRSAVNPIFYLLTT